jgi:transposase
MWEQQTSNGKRRLRLNHSDLPRVKHEPVSTEEYPFSVPTIYTGGKSGFHTKPIPIDVNGPRMRRVVKFLEEGLPYNIVAKYLGVKMTTVELWLRKGQENHNESYRKFYKLCSSAESKAQRELLKKLRQHEDNDWRVPAWMLERRWPDQWGKRDALKAELRVSSNVTERENKDLSKRVLVDKTSRELARNLIDGRTFGYSEVKKKGG